ncbi:MAG TPA: hypothetical protein PLK34_02085 [Candidatus Pacearchaeota archaeon]|nr:hypothetical protein [Candidatus Pacearchaeota archaeon]
METQKIIVILLIVAIIFSVASILFNVTFVRNLDPSRLNYSQGGVKSSGQIGIEILPSSGATIQ